MKGGRPTRDLRGVMGLANGVHAVSVVVGRLKVTVWKLPSGGCDDAGSRLRTAIAVPRELDGIP